MTTDEQVLLVNPSDLAALTVRELAAEHDVPIEINSWVPPGIAYLTEHPLLWRRFTIALLHVPPASLTSERPERPGGED